MTGPMPEPLDGHEYDVIADRCLLAHRLGLSVSGTDAGRLVATVEATRRIVDELRDASGLTDVLRHDMETSR